MRRPGPAKRRVAATTPGVIVSSDIGIAQNATLKPIGEIAARLGIPAASIENYGHYKAKIALDYIDTLKDKPDGKLILVTAISPTPAGEGKTTTTVGLGDALNRIGKRAVICLREPSLGPVFGMKGGATGGGYSQVVPMEDINLHFTGDFSDIAMGLGGPGNGYPRQDSFLTVVASEVMAILCLAPSLGDLKNRLGNIVV